MSEQELGCYTGKLVLESLNGGQQMKTMMDFGFLDSDGKLWAVPQATLVNGASIPKALWSLVGGGLWEGKYREAAVVHDYSCAVRSMDWPSVHRMLYHAMLASGASVHRAKLMYAGVYFAGPRWNDIPSRHGQPVAPPQTSPANVLYALCRDPFALAVSEAIEYDGNSAFDWIGHYHPDNVSGELILELDRLSDMVEEDDPSLRDLEVAIEGALNLIPRAVGAPRKISIGRLAPPAE